MKTNVHALYRGRLARPVPAIAVQLVAIALVLVAVRSVRSTGAVAIVTAAGSGLLAWSFFEYALHRWIMHSRIRKLWELLHQEHHQMKVMIDPGHRLMHPVVPFLLFGGGAFAVSNSGAAVIGVAAFWFGYLVYEAIHWAHHDEGVTRALSGSRYFAHRRRIHHDHHVRPKVNFGFTSAFWDRALGTYLDPAEATARAEPPAVPSA